MSEATLIYQYENVGGDFIEKDLSGIKNGLCLKCGKCKTDCPGMGDVYTGCVFYQKAPYLKMVFPGYAEQWIMKYDSNTSFDENMQKGKKFSNNACYKGFASNNPDDIVFVKYCK